MARKPKKKAGAPEWVVTYGDMMSLLLVFFIMLVALSEIVEEERYRAIVEEIKESFGMQGGGARLPTEEDPRLSLIEVLEQMQRQEEDHPERAQARDPGTEGRHMEVTKIREGKRFVVGGRITFEPGGTELDAHSREQLRGVAEQIRGHNNIVEIRGHADSGELHQAVAAFPDLWTLSYARAREAMAYLSGEEVGIRRERLRLVANADREPLARRVQDRAQREPNRRVEIVVTEALVDEHREPEQPTSRRSWRGFEMD